MFKIHKFKSTNLKLLEKQIFEKKNINWILRTKII